MLPHAPYTITITFTFLAVRSRRLSLDSLQQVPRSFQLAHQRKSLALESEERSSVQPKAHVNDGHL
jgi:hypothetical protein